MQSTVDCKDHSHTVVTKETGDTSMELLLGMSTKLWRLRQEACAPYHGWKAFWKLTHVDTPHAPADVTSDTISVHYQSVSVYFHARRTNLCVPAVTRLPTGLLARSPHLCWHLQYVPRGAYATPQSPRRWPSFAADAVDTFMTRSQWQTLSSGRLLMRDALKSLIRWEFKGLLSQMVTGDLHWYQKKSYSARLLDRQCPSQGYIQAQNARRTTGSWKPKNWADCSYRLGSICGINWPPMVKYSYTLHGEQKWTDLLSLGISNGTVFFSHDVLLHNMCQQPLRNLPAMWEPACTCFAVTHVKRTHVCHVSRARIRTITTHM